MTQNDNHSPLPMYTARDMQNHRQSYAYGQIYPLYAKKNMLLPFQVTRKHMDDNHNFGVSLFDTDDNEISTGNLYTLLNDAFIDAGLSCVEFPDRGYDVIVYPATMPLSVNLPIGQYYLRFSDGVNSWYSEVMTLVNDISGYTTVEWWDDQDMVLDGTTIVYASGGTGYRNRLHFATEIGKPEYGFEEEGEDIDGFFFPQKQISEKTFRCSTYAPESICDAIRLARLADYVVVTDKYGRKYDCDTFLTSVEWQQYGDVAQLDMEFETDTVVKKLGKGRLMMERGDYNDDYNADYDNENAGQ